MLTLQLIVLRVHAAALLHPAAMRQFMIDDGADTESKLEPCNERFPRARGFHFLLCPPVSSWPTDPLLKPISSFFCFMIALNEASCQLAAAATCLEILLDQDLYGSIRHDTTHKLHKPYGAATNPTLPGANYSARTTPPPLLLLCVS
ncbi:hypothetical protein BC826DRAFT_102814 [Russula brevipes]|nr:hypothetical protein BC826DRAFT_102814 [Russula brevipes]